MTDQQTNVVAASTTAAPLPDGVRELHDFDSVPPVDGCRIFTHYNGPTNQLQGLCVGMCVLDPGASPHPPHQHPEEEFMIVSSGTGEILCDGKTTPVGPGAVMYCAGQIWHGIVNTGNVPLTFYWSKWLAKGS